MKKILTAASALALAVAVATPAHAASAKRCGPGLYAGAHTSCALARALLAKVGRDAENIADGNRVRVRSPITGKSYAFFLYAADGKSFTCRAYGDGVLTVRIST
jgi:hypothetical protein